MWKVTQKAVLTLSLTMRPASNGLSPLLSDTWMLEISFVSCLFFWIKRSGNTAAHEAAKYTIMSFSSFSFCVGNLLAFVAFVCLGDAQALSISG